MILLLTACATTQQIKTPITVGPIDLAPRAIHEQCLKLVAGDRIAYRFITEAPVDFNIHYHIAPAIITPLEKTATTGESAFFLVHEPQTYCLMWRGHPELATLLKYRIEVDKAP